ncbi:hypothetical protein PISMIDRAFT_19079, partial [Pisolithus microcarpus 441]
HRSARLAVPAAHLTPILASPLSTPVPSIHDHHDMAPCIVTDTSSSIPPPTWTATPPTPPPAPFSHRPCSVHVSACPESPVDPSVVVKRRASLPLSLVSKPLPPIPVPPPSLPATANRRHDTSRPRPLFHFGTDVPEKEGPPSTSDAVSKENARRRHALSELLSTELGYLIDLRILVCVYLRLLPILVTRSASASTHTSSSNLNSAPFSRTPSLLGISYLGGGPRAPSNQLINGTKPLSSSTQSTDCYAHNLLIFQPLPVAKDKDKNSPRHLFSPSDLDTVTRNADQILELHERLVRRLRTAVAQFGFPMKWDDDDTLDRSTHPADLQRAIDAVSTVFMEHASSFDRYRSFCSGHPEALNAVHKVQQRYPFEWEAFEQRFFRAFGHRLGVIQEEAATFALVPGCLDSCSGPAPRPGELQFETTQYQHFREWSRRQRYRHSTSSPSLGGLPDQAHSEDLQVPTTARPAAVGCSGHGTRLPSLLRGH